MLILKLLGKMLLVGGSGVIIWFAVVGARATWWPPVVQGQSFDPADPPMSIVVRRMLPRELLDLPRHNPGLWPIVRAELSRRHRNNAARRPRTMADLARRPITQKPNPPTAKVR